MADLLIASVEGEVTHKPKATPKVKPKRRQPSYKNKTQQSTYMKEYMEDYRGEQGKDYQKVPDKVKKFRAEQRARLKEKFNLKVGFGYV